MGTAGGWAGNISEFRLDLGGVNAPLDGEERVCWPLREVVAGELSFAASLGDELGMSRVQGQPFSERDCGLSEANRTCSDKR